MILMKNKLLFISILVVLCISIGSASAVDINTESADASGITNEINVVDAIDINVDDTNIDVKYDDVDDLNNEDKESSDVINKSSDIKSSVNTKEVKTISAVSASQVSSESNTKTISSVSASTVTTAQILTSAVNLKNYVLNHHGLPSTVTVNGKSYGTEEFLYLMTLVLKDINAGKTSKSYSIKSVPDHGKDLNGDWVLSLKLTKAQYLDVAKRVGNYIVNNGKVPNYATLINGKKGDYKLYTYEFACILSSYKTTKSLPSSCTFDCSIFQTYSISSKLLSLVGKDLTFYLTTDNIVGKSTDSAALNTLKNTLTSLGYKVKVLGVGPNYHNVAYQYGCTGSNSVLLCCFGGVDVCPIEEWVGKTPGLGDWFPTNYKGANILSVFYLDPYGCAANLNTYVGVAWDKKSGYYGEPLNNPAKYMSDNGISYIQTGTVNAVASILKSVFKKSGPTPVPTAKYVTISNILSASSSLKSYVVKNHVLPSSITVGSYKVNSAQFSYLMGAAIKQIKAGKAVSTKIKIISVKVPSYSTYSTSYTAKSSAYVDMASRVANYCSSNGVAPKYAAIGSKKADLRSYAYAFAKVLTYYKSYKKLPSSVLIESKVFK